MGFRCEVCDEFLPMFQFSHLCPTCYKLRTIIKCYSAMDVLKNAEENFLVSRARELEERDKDLKFYTNEETRLQKEMIENFNPTAEQIEAVKKEVENQQVIPDDTEKIKSNEHKLEIDNPLPVIKEEVEAIPLPPLNPITLNPNAKPYNTRCKGKFTKRNNNID